MNERSAVEDIYLSIKKNIKRQWVVAFIACCVIGVLTYGYIMTHHFLTYDSMWNIYSDQDMISSGRPFLTYACAISSYYDFPYLNGILAIFYLALTSVLLVELFKIKNPICAILISGLLVTFPSVISTFCYTFTVDGYMLSVLLITAALLVTERKKWGFVLGAVLLGTSIGIYQAYLAYVMVLCVTLVLLQILEERKLVNVFAKIISYAGMGIGGYIFYLLSLNTMLQVKGVSLSGYQGSDKVNSFSITALPQGIKTAFTKFIDFARYGNIITVTETMTLSVLVLVIVGIGMYGYLFVAKGCCKKWWSWIAAGVMALCLPVCGAVISVLSPDTYYHTLMWTGWCVPFIFVVILSERMAGYSRLWEGKIKKAVAGLVFVCTAVLIFEFTKVANIVGFNMEERYEKNYALTLRIVELLEETTGYEHGMKVAILGGEPNEKLFPTTEITAEDLKGYFGAYGDYSLNSTTKYATFMEHYMNVTIQTIDYADEVELTQTKEFLEMEYFPSSECVRLIGDVWVVKLNG